MDRLDSHIPRVNRFPPAVTERGFCARCGGVLTFRSIENHGEIDVSIGSFDRPDASPPSHHVGAPERIAWLPMDDGPPRYRRGTAEGLNPGAEKADPAG